MWKYVYLPTPNFMNKTWNTKCVCWKYWKHKMSNIFQAFRLWQADWVNLSARIEDNWSQPPGIEGLWSDIWLLSCINRRSKYPQNNHRSILRGTCACIFLILVLTEMGFVVGSCDKRRGQILNNWPLKLYSIYGGHIK